MSNLEEKFILLWDELYPRLPLERESMLIPQRKFRCDFVHRPSRVVIEINGGTWINGRHNRSSSMQSEYEKLNLLTYHNYRVFQLSSAMINPIVLRMIGDYIFNKIDL
jgi:very-short-patch-repair endonuclease